MTYKITQSCLTPELRDAIFQEFSQHAINAVGFDGLATQPVVFEMIDNGLNMGVCVCQLFWGNLHIKYLLTKEAYRERGVGRTLMDHALRYGKEQGCRFAFVETMNFQAPEFYQKLGFTVELKRDGYAAGTSFYYLRIDL